MRERRSRNHNDNTAVQVVSAENVPSAEILTHFNIWTNDQAVGIARRCEALALEMEELLVKGPEKAIGMRKLLEAKDCFVRAKLK